MENVFKSLRGYKDSQINNPIANPFTGWERLETIPNRFIFKYEGGQTISLVRTRSENLEGQSVLSRELGLDWPDFGFSCEAKKVVTR
jgi:hypothetical protein